MEDGRFARLAGRGRPASNGGYWLMIVNFAERAHNHNWALDPVTRSLLDTDFYKLLMLQFIWKHYPNTPVSFSLFNRSSNGPVDTFAHEELVEQLEHARSVRFRR